MLDWSQILLFSTNHVLAKICSTGSESRKKDKKKQANKKKKKHKKRTINKDLYTVTKIIFSEKFYFEKKSVFMVVYIGDLKETSTREKKFDENGATILQSSLKWFEQI